MSLSYEMVLGFLGYGAEPCVSLLRLYDDKIWLGLNPLKMSIIIQVVKRWRYPHSFMNISEQVSFVWNF